MKNVLSSYLIQFFGEQQNTVTNRNPWNLSWDCGVEKGGEGSATELVIFLSFL